MDTEFVKLSDVNIGPCRPCMRCVYTNECVIKDDFRWIAPKIMKADALVVGSPIFFGLPSAFTKAFMERLYALRHVNILTKGKIGAAVAVRCAAEKDVETWLGNILSFSKLDVAGAMPVKVTPCCFVCGPGETCECAAWNAYSPEVSGRDYCVRAVYKSYLEILPDNAPYVKGPAIILRRHRSVGDEPDVMDRARSLGEAIVVKLEARARRG